MTTFALLILVTVAIGAGVLALRHWHGPGWTGNYRYHSLRSSDSADYYAGLDRDAVRVDAEVLAMSRRAPHN